MPLNLTVDKLQIFSFYYSKIKRRENITYRGHQEEVLSLTVAIRKSSHELSNISPLISV